MSLYNLLTEYYNEIFPFNNQKKQFFKKYLEISGLYVLDAGCATGELVFYAETLNNKCTGIDITDAFINKALEKKKAISSNSEFININMLEIDRQFKQGSFDVITSIGNTLPHLDKNQIKLFLFKAADILSNNGILITQFFNFDNIIDQNYYEFPLIETENIIFRRYYDITNKETIKFHINLTNKDTQENIISETILYPLFFKDFNQMCDEAGFYDRDYFGNFDNSSLNSQNSSLIAILKK